jgi:HK97 family phage major capsid protein
LLAVYVSGSYEVLGDTNIEDQLPRTFAVGSGSGAPTGVVTAVAAVTASRVDPTTGGSFGVADVHSTIEAVPPRHRPRSTWVANYSTMNAIRGFDSSGGSSFWADLNADSPARLVGPPIVESSEMDSAVTTGSNLLVCGDFSEYLVYDRLGTVIAYEPIVKGANQRPAEQAGWLMSPRVGADALNANAFAVLQLE